MDEVEAGVWTGPADAAVPVSEDGASSMTSLYSFVLAACNEAELYDVTTQLFIKAREANVPAADDQHHAFVLALCRTGRVSLASAHLAQMPAAFDVLPNLVDFCAVMSAAAGTPHSEERGRLLSTTARLELFSSLLLSLHDGVQHVRLDHFSTDEAVFTVVRGLLLWLQWVDSERFDEGLVASVQSTNCAVQLLASNQQHQTGLCANITAVLSESVSETTTKMLIWHKASGEQWLLDLPVSVVKEVRDRADLERGANGQQPPVQSRAEQSESGEQNKTLMQADDDAQSTADLTSLSAPHRLPREHHAP